MLCNSELAFLHRNTNAKRAGREGGQIQFFSPRLQLCLARSVHATGWLCRLQVNSLSQAEPGGEQSSGGRSRRSRRPERRRGRGAARAVPRPAGRRQPQPAPGTPLSLRATPPGPDTTRAHGSASAFFSTSQKQTRCLKQEIFELF